MAAQTKVDGETKGDIGTGGEESAAKEGYIKWAGRFESY